MKWMSRTWVFLCNVDWYAFVMGVVFWLAAHWLVGFEKTGPRDFLTAVMLAVVGGGFACAAGLSARWAMCCEDSDEPQHLCEACLAKVPAAVPVAESHRE